jgi:hypothetical protein
MVHRLAVGEPNLYYLSRPGTSWPKNGRWHTHACSALHGHRREDYVMARRLPKPGTPRPGVR